MKGLIKSSLAAALALASGQALALGLGAIQVKSGLNQPLVAEIPVIADSAADAADLRAELASAEDFQRVGLSRSRVGIPIEFAIGNNGRGQTVIKLTTKDIVREPFLDFLIEVNWSKGKLLREYTVLLDPPVTAPTVVTSSKPAAAPVPQPMAQPRAEKPQPVQAKPPVVASEAPPRPASKSAAPRAAGGGEYGPVEKGQTLSAIASGLDVSDGKNLNQLMLALLKANPDAFYRDNVNALKTGAVLRIPTPDEIAATGSFKESAAAMQAQFQAWQDSSKPTLVAQTGAPPVADVPAVPTKGGASTKPERLALVPPAGKGDSSADRAGRGSGSGKDSADLARTKEALASREQESNELKSRVKQLEDINDKGQHLLSVKDSEIAELQNKLKELQAAKAAAATAAATTTLTATAIKPSDATKPADASATKPASTTPPVAPTASATPPAPSPSSTTSTATPPPTAPASTTPTATAPSTTASTTASTTPSSATAVVPPVSSTSAAPAPASPPATSSTTSTASSTPPPAATPEPSAAMKPAPTVAKAPAPAKPAEPAKSWYSDYLGDSPYPLYGLGAILLLVGGWLMTRFFSKPKAAVRPQYANDLGAHEADSVVEEDSIDNFAPHAQEQELLDRLAQDPDNVSHSLELLRHYYVQSDATHFEALAEDLHLRLPEDSAEWQEVLAMGEGLLPHHELFALPGTAHDAGATHEHEFTFDAEPEPAPADLQTQRFDFHDLETHAAQIPPAIDAVHGEHARDTGFEFEHEPAAQPHEHVANGTAEPEHEAALDEFLVDEDTIGTRLDLARAYLDMGDPDGARSMLDEVLAEGNEGQKEEARKLLSELR